MHQKGPIDPIRSTRESAEYLGVLAEGTLVNWRTQGTGPRFVKVGARVGYRQSDLDAWLATRERQSTRDGGVAAASALANSCSEGS